VEPVEASVALWKVNQNALAYPIGSSMTTYLISGALKNHALVRTFLRNCFRESGFPNAAYAEHLHFDVNSFSTSHTLSLGISPPDPFSAPVVNAIMKQFRSTMPQFASATIDHVVLLLQGLTSSPIAELRPQSSPSLHLMVALWKQSSLTFESYGIDDGSSICIPPLEIADFIVTDFGHLRLFTFRGEWSAAPRLYNALLWIKLRVLDQVHILTAFDVQNLQQPQTSTSICGRCGKNVLATDSELIKRCHSCSGNPPICATCYAERPAVTALDCYSLEMEACSSLHPIAVQMSRILKDGRVLKCCSCASNSWS
jgi:hypothetical protein